MESKQEIIDVFYAEDGTKFLNETECKAHEQEQAARKKRLDGIRYFVVIHGAECTEGRGWYGCTHIAFEEKYKQEGYVPPAVIAFCMDAFGYPLAWVQGVAQTDGWRVYEGDANRWANRKTDYAQVGDYKYPATAAFISEVAHDDFPPNLIPGKWDKLKLREYLEKYK